MSQTRSREIKPVMAAVTVGLSFFVGTMEIFVAIMALAVAGRQNHPHAGVGVNWSNDSAMRIAYAVAAVSLINSLLAFGRARLRPFVTALCTMVFAVTVLLVNVLFIRAW